MLESSLAERVREAFPDDVLQVHAFRGDETVVLRAEAWPRVAGGLKTNEAFAFDYLMDLTAVDLLGREPRFEVVAHLYSTTHNHRLRLKVGLAESDPEVDTLTGLWSAADWYEREIFDMFGVRFRDHPNLRRILMYEGFEGHPLRKDYPIRRRQPIIGPPSS